MSVQYRAREQAVPHATACSRARYCIEPQGIYSISPLYLAHRALAAAFSFLLVASETVRFGFLLLTVANAAAGLPRRRALAAATPGIIFASCSRCAVRSLICMSMLAIAALMCSAGLPLPDFLGMRFSPSIKQICSLFEMFRCYLAV